jgi:DNA repair protein RecO (recombination protein O)
MPTHDALVVAVHPSGDTALVVDLLTPDAGRLSCVGRAARRSRQRFVGGLDRLCRLDAETEPPRRGELHELVGSVVTDAHEGLRRDPLALGRAAYITELAAALTPRGHASEVSFLVATGAVRALCAGPGGAGLLRWAEVQLLCEAGVLAPTDVCPSCHTPLQRRAYASPHNPGELRCGNCRGPSDTELGGAEVVQLLSGCSVWTLQEALAAEVPSAVSVTVGRWLWAVLQPALGGRVLRSARFLAQLQRAGG